MLLLASLWGGQEMKLSIVTSHQTIVKTFDKEFGLFSYIMGKLMLDEV